MLIRFNTENFLSFNKNQEFSMSPGRVKMLQSHLIESGEIKLLKYGAIYGANASGKSNFVKAIDVAKDIIMRGIEKVVVSDKYFKFIPASKTQPTVFEFEIKLDGKCYAYGFQALLAKKTIYTEWLYEISKNEEKVIFERDVANSTFKVNIVDISDEDKNKLDVYSDDIKSMNGDLFLSEMARKSFGANSELNIFKNIYHWFAKNLVVVYPDTPLGGIKGFFSKNEKTRLIEMLEMFDTGITRFKLKNISEEELYNSNIPKRILDDIFEDFNTKKELKYALVNGMNNIFEISHDSNEKLVIKKLFFEHGRNNSDIDFEYHEESDGTKRLIELLMVIQQSTTSSGKVFIVDEIDRSLHPQLTKKFVELFFRLTEGTDTQLITTTHESELMDLSLLRRDEIWFVERDENYQSRIFSLDQFKERYDKKVSKAYLEGRYGALPVFKNFKNILEYKNDQT